jgi:hypothetical protein
MKHSRLLLLATHVTVALACMPALAVAAGIGGGGVPGRPPGSNQPASGGATGSEASTSGSGSPTPLKGVLRLSPAIHRGAGAGRMYTTISVDQLTQKFAKFSSDASVYESGAKQMSAAAQTCSSKAYSVQDQMAAGCTGTESLNQCMNKLYKHCIDTFSGNPTAGPSARNTAAVASRSVARTGGFSTSQFLQTARATASEARALSQTLTQYASQVENNARALAP